MTALAVALCFAATLAVTAFVWRMAEHANAKDAVKVRRRQRLIKEQLARQTEDREYLRLHGIAADVLNGPYDHQRPLGVALGKTAAENEPSDTQERPTKPLRALVVPAVSPSAVDEVAS